MYNYRETITQSRKQIKGILPIDYSIKSYNDLVQSIVFSIIQEVPYNWIICEGLSEKIYFEEIFKNEILNNNLRILPLGSYKEVKKVLKRKGLDTDFNFVSVLENHKNLSIHSHNIYYMTKEQIEIFKHCYKLIKKRYKLKQCKFLILKTSKGSSYLMKYLIKDNESEFYKKYRSFYSKYRFFKCSNISKYSQKVLDITYQYLKSNHNY